MRVRQLGPKKFYKLFGSPVEAPQCRYCGSRNIAVGSAVIKFDAKTQTWVYIDGGEPDCGDCDRGHYEVEGVTQWMLFDNFFQLEDE